MATQAIGLKMQRRMPISKRTSQGSYGRPKNKHKRRQWKAYNRQG
jgi:hypothetical protein